jgi:hypothetical protein
MSPTSCQLLHPAPSSISKTYYTIMVVKVKPGPWGKFISPPVKPRHSNLPDYFFAGGKHFWKILASSDIMVTPSFRRKGEGKGMAIEITTFGEFDIKRAGRSILPKSSRANKNLELLKYFITHRHKRLVPVCLTAPWK